MLFGQFWWKTLIFLAKIKGKTNQGCAQSIARLENLRIYSFFIKNQKCLIFASINIYILENLFLKYTKMTTFIGVVLNLHYFYQKKFFSERLRFLIAIRGKFVMDVGILYHFGYKKTFEKILKIFWAKKYHHHHDLHPPKL